MNWLNKFQELLEYKKKYDHCNVTYTHEHQALFHWVQEQRDDYAKLNMSEERIKMLHGIGFSWLTKEDHWWLFQLRQLQLFKSKHGHCNVPAKYEENQQFANWVHRQRTCYKQLKLSDERITMLNSIGFAWTVSQKDYYWNDKFEQLKQYKSKHGDCNVPNTYEENQALSRWVEKQRTRYKQLKLSDEHINMLNAIGFNWNTTKEKIWSDKFEQLKQYKSKHGDCNVPRIYEENQPLAIWVQTQRKRYKQLKLSDERTNMLNSIGFNWSSYTRSWNDKFEQLNQYKAKYGDCNVPSIYVKNQSLANWVQIQRTRYKQLKLSDKCIEMLNTIGFSWTAPSRIKTYNPVATLRNEIDSKKVEREVSVGFEINPKPEDSVFKQNNEYIKTCNSITPETYKTKKSTVELELIVRNEIDTEQKVNEIEQNSEQIAIETSHQESKEKVATNEEKVPAICKRSLQEKVQVLCKLSIMFQEQKDVIYADIKKRKLDDSALLKRSKQKRN